MSGLLGPTPHFSADYAIISEEARQMRAEIIIERVLGTSDMQSIRQVDMRPSPFAKVYERLTAFRSLQQDWDSYGSRPISESAYETAKALLTHIAVSDSSLGSRSLVPYHIAPVPDGGVQIEWRNDQAALELWISAEGSLGVVIDRPSSSPRIVERAFHSKQAAVSEIEAFAR